MSDMNPVGIPITLGGIERRLLFTINLIDQIQDKTGKPIIETVKNIDDVKVLRYLTTALINDEIERTGEGVLVTEKQVGYWIARGFNEVEVVNAILDSYGISLPKPDDEDEDPNLKSEL